MSCRLRDRHRVRAGRGWVPPPWQNEAGGTGYGLRMVIVGVRSPCRRRESTRVCSGGSSSNSLWASQRTPPISGGRGNSGESRTLRRKPALGLPGVGVSPASLGKSSLVPGTVIMYTATRFRTVPENLLLQLLSLLLSGPLLYPCLPLSLELLPEAEEPKLGKTDPSFPKLE